MYLLDTDTLTHLHMGHLQVVERLRRVQDREVGTTIVTRVEILRARYDSLLKAADGEQLKTAQARMDLGDRLLSEITIITFDDSSAAQFDRLRRNKKLAKIGRADLLIASITLVCRAILVTRNLRHFRPISGLELENWVD